MSLSKLSVQDVSDLLDAHFENPLESPESYNDIKYGSEGKIPGLGYVKLVDEYGGEGQGEEYWVVFSVSDGEVTRLFRMDGYYASYCGSEFDGELKEVQARQKTVTVYE